MRHPYPARQKVSIAGTISVDEAKRRLLNYSGFGAPTLKAKVLGRTTFGGRISLRTQVVRRRQLNPALRARLVQDDRGLSLLQGVIYPQPLFAVGMLTAPALLLIAILGNMGGLVVAAFGVLVAAVWIEAQFEAATYDARVRQLLDAATDVVGARPLPND